MAAMKQRVNILKGSEYFPYHCMPVSLMPNEKVQHSGHRAAPERRDVFPPLFPTCGRFKGASEESIGNNEFIDRLSLSPGGYMKADKT